MDAERFLSAASARGYRLFTGVPCSYLKPFINAVIDSPELRYVGATNEGDAVAIAAGAELGGSLAVVMLQNSGLGNAVSPLTSLTHTFRIPLLFIVTWRGEPGGAPDEPQHELMGQITPALLETMRIPWELFPAQEAEVEPALGRAAVHMREHGTPYALVLRKGTLAPRALEAEPVAKALPHTGALPKSRAARVSRHDALAAIQAATDERDVLIASTGYTGRELYALDDRPNQLYMVGSMGCASSLGLGLALARPDRRVIVLDGDGAFLMRMGALATIGYERPANLLHVLLDNGRHESTGGQATVSGSIDPCAIAAGCGYGSVARAAEPDEIADSVRAAGDALAFVHVPIRPGTPADLPRPTVKPPEVASRLRAELVG